MVSKKFNCLVCKKKFATKATLTSHASIHKKSSHLITRPMKKTKSQKPHTCNICDKTFPTNFKLIRHGYTHLAVKPFPCDTCEKRFSRKDHLQVHYRLHTGEKTCFCMECGDGFNTTTSLHRHIIRIHSENRRTVACRECGLEFGFKSQLKRHFDYVHRETFTCNFCGNISSSDAALYRHMKKHILTPPFVCLMCASHFNTPEIMADHQCFAVEDDPCKVVVRVALIDAFDFEDEIDVADQNCALMLEKKFDQRGRRRGRRNYAPKDLEGDLYDFFDREIKANIEYSDSQPNEDIDVAFESDDPANKLMCKFCEKIFPTEVDKLVHESSHLEDNTSSMQCKLCHVVCSSKYRLNQHMRTHVGKNPYRCKFCEMSFSSQDLLQRHMCSAHATDDVTCPFCFALCETSEELEYHLNFHNDPDFKSNDEQSGYQGRYSSQQSQTLSAKVKFEQQCLQTSDNEDILTIDESNDTENDISTSKTGIEKWKCLKCQITFQSLKAKTKHMKSSHSEDTYFECDMCPCRFSTEGGLRGHLRILHGKTAASLNLFSDSQHRREKKFNTHNYENNHSSANAHQCKDCEATFDNLHDFLVHVRNHTSSEGTDDKLICVLCSEEFTTTEGLYQHLENHEDSMVVEVGVLDSLDGKE